MQQKYICRNIYKPHLKSCKDHLGLWKRDSTNTLSNGSWPVVVSVSLLPFLVCFFTLDTMFLGSEATNMPQIGWILHIIERTVLRL